MSKTVLIVDKIDNCLECPMCYKSDSLSLGNFEYKQLYSCKCIPEDVEDVYLDNILKEKPSWCPLKEVPQKMAEENRWFSKDYAEGFIACVDEILKENDK